MLEYFYASPHVSIMNDNAFDVLAAAHYLGATVVQTACVEFLAQVGLQAPGLSCVLLCGLVYPAPRDSLSPPPLVPPLPSAAGDAFLNPGFFTAGSGAARQNC